MAADDNSSAEIIRLPPSTPPSPLPPAAAAGGGVTGTVAAMERRFQSHHQRATSEASAANSSAKLSRLRSVLRRTGSRDDKSVGSSWSTLPAEDAAEDGSSPAPRSPAEEQDLLPVVVSADNNSNSRQLREYVQRLRAARVPGTEPAHVDAAYREYAKLKGQCLALTRALLTPREAQGRTAERKSVVPRTASHEKLVDGLEKIFERLEAEKVRMTSIATLVAEKEAAGLMGRPSAAWLGPVRDWKACLESLLEVHRASLSEMYKEYEKDATPEMVERLFADKAFRAQAIQRMRSAGVYKIQASPLEFWPKYENRFRNYERLRQDLGEITNLLQVGESGISLDRIIREYTIAARGDAVLEFANTAMEWKPAYRFRVSSHMLAETSPIFAHMFSREPDRHLDNFASEEWDMDGLEEELPPAPSSFVYPDGSEVKLYRMPQLELNKEEALTALLHAAHMHNDKMPRDISFEKFVAIAEVSLRYRCTSPVEVFVEHRWLPQWMHKATEDMPDGLLLISYAYGLRRLFTRMSKTAIMNIVDERELKNKPWPQKVKDKVWAVRNAKMAQVHTACRSAIEEYLRPPMGGSGIVEPNTREDMAIPQGTSISGLMTWSQVTTQLKPLPAPPSSNYNTAAPISLTSSPRCPKGSQWCDATNLGWLLLVYNELHLLSTVMRSTVLSHLQQPQPPPRSLAQLVDALRLIPSPPNPVHAGPGGRGGVCDPAPVFRDAINDIYNSVSGLTLFDISGRQHGWALSRRRRDEPQAILRVRRAGRRERSRSQDTASDKQRPIISVPESVYLRVLWHLDSLEDIHAAAMASRGFYETFKKNELALMRNVVRGERRRTLMILTGAGDAVGEKIPKCEAEALKAHLDDIKTKQRAGSTSGATAVSEQGDIEIEGTTVQDGSESDTEALMSDYATPAASVRDETEPPPDDMTEDEARQILWPDEPVALAEPPPLISIPPGFGEDREKFRLEDRAIVEEKTLVVVDQKQLREVYDRRMGLTSGVSHDMDE